MAIYATSSSFNVQAFLSFTTQPTGVQPNVVFSCVVKVVDTHGTACPNYTGNVTVAIGTNPGTGVYRRFPEREVKIAALLRPLAEIGVPAGWLHRFAREFRQAINGEGKSKTERRLTRALERARSGEGENFLLFTHDRHSMAFEVVSDDTGAPLVNLSRLFSLFDLIRRPTLVAIICLNSVFSKFSTD